MKGEASSPADFRFSTGEGGYQGFFWGRTLTPIALRNLQLSHSVHFEIPQMAVFDGTANGETMEGTFRDGTGEGSFRLEKQLDWDDPRNGPWGAARHWSLHVHGTVTFPCRATLIGGPAARAPAFPAPDPRS